MTEKTALLLNELTPTQKNYVTNRLAAKEKDLSVAYLCWFFCIHYFYLRNETIVQELIQEATLLKS